MLIGLRGTTYNDQITAAIPQYCPSCPPSLVLSLVQQESGGNQFGPNGQPLTSSTNDIGLFQLQPATAASLGVDPATPAGNIQGGLTYLQQMYNQFGNWPEALEAYNEGPGALASQISAGTTPTSQAYASTILANANLPSSTASPSSLPSFTCADGGVVTEASFCAENMGDDDSSDDSSSLGLSTGIALALAAALGLVMIANA